MSDDPFFFGYGSLVNTDTHSYPRAAPARLTGWGRTWRQTAHRPVAYLTAEPRPGTAIDGLIAAVPGHDWAALDQREAGYDRVGVTGAITHQANTGEIAVYAIPEGKLGRPDAPRAILQSYLDTVLQGYLRVFGRAGMAGFIATTTGWEVPFVLDRDAPLYPRATGLSARESTLIDSALQDLPLRPCARDHLRP